MREGLPFDRARRFVGKATRQKMTMRRTSNIVKCLPLASMVRRFTAVFRENSGRAVPLIVKGARLPQGLKPDYPSEIICNSLPRPAFSASQPADV